MPVYTVWGACEDVRVLEKFRSGEYKVPNLHIIDEARSMLVEVGGVKLRLLGLGGAVVMHKLFDNGEGRTTIAGGQGTMWTTLLQMGELVDTANRVYDPTETRVFVTHASPAREGILNQLSVTLKADFSISAGLHFRYGSSYNEFSVNPTLDHYRGKLAASKASFNDVWETVKSEVEPAIQQNEAQLTLLHNALGIVEKMPTTAAGGNPFGGAGAAGAALGQVDESAFKNMWNFNLADAAFGYLVLEIQDGRIGTEMRAQGFNFSHRGAKQQGNSQVAQAPITGAVPAVQPPATQTAPAPVPAAAPVTQRQPSQPAASSTPVNPAAKPGTPQPAQKGGRDTEKPAAAAANGTLNGGPESAPSPVQKTPAENIVGLFVMNVQSDEQTRDLFADEDKDKIVKVERWGNNNKVVQFASAEDRDTAMAHLPDESKTRAQGEDRSRPLVKIFQHRETRGGGFGRGGAGGGGGGGGSGGGAGTWGSSARGGGSGAASAGGAGGLGGQSGYRSAGGGTTGTASDSEGGAGRRGGRGGGGGGGGRGGRGGERGGRGRGSRGGMNKGGENTGSPAPAAASASPAE